MEKTEKLDVIGSEQKTDTEETATFEQASAPAPQTVSDPSPVPDTAQPGVAKKAVSWWDKKVTRKFVTIAIVGALLLNIAFTAGMMKLFNPRRGFDKDGMRGSGRPGNEQYFGNDQNGRGGMMPPDGGQQRGKHNHGNQQFNDQQPGNQQPENQQPGDQKSDDKQDDNKSDDKKSSGDSKTTAYSVL